MPSKRYRLNKQDLVKILQVILWSGVSAMLATAISLVQEIDIPMTYMVLVPVVNTTLYAAKKLVDQKSE